MIPYLSGAFATGMYMCLYTFTYKRFRVLILWISVYRHFSKNHATRSPQERRDIDDMVYETNKTNLDMRLKKFAKDHPDSNFLGLYGWKGKLAEPRCWSNVFVNGLVKTRGHT